LGAREFFEFYLDHLCAIHNAGTEKGQLEVVKAMGEMVRKTGDAVLIDKYAQKTSMKLSSFMQLPVSPDAVRTQFKKSSRPLPAQTAGSETPEDPDQPMPSDREMWLLRFVLGSDEHLDWLAEHLELEWIQHPTVRSIVADRLQAHADHSGQGVAAFLTSQSDPFAQSLISEAVASELGKVDLARNLAEATRMLRNSHIERRLSTLTARVSQPGLTDEQLVEIEKEKAYLRRCKTEPLRARADA
jgi:DNA primase